MSGALYLQLLRSQTRTFDAAARAKAVNAFLVEDLLLYSDPFNSGMGEPTLRQALNSASENIAVRFAGQPANEAAVRRALAGAHIGRDELDAAQAQLEQAERLFDGIEVDPDLRLDLRGQRAEVKFARGKFTEARALLGDPDAFTVVPGASEAQFHAAWLSALIERRLGRVDSAIELFAALAAAGRLHYGADDPSTLMLQRYHADSLRTGGRLAEARAVSERSYESAKRHYGVVDFRVAGFVEVLARIESQLGNHERALALLLEAELMRATVLPATHRAVWILREQIVVTYIALGRREDALAMAERIWLDLAPQAGPSVDALIVLGNLAKQRATFKTLEIGIVHATTVADLWRKHHPSNRPEALIQRAQLARLLQQAGRWQQAEAQLSALMELAKSALPANGARLGSMHHCGRRQSARQ